MNSSQPKETKMTQGHKSQMDWMQPMIDRVMSNVNFALSLGMTKEEAISYAKERSTAGSQVWEIVRAEMAA